MRFITRWITFNIVTLFHYVALTLVFYARTYFGICDFCAVINCVVQHFLPGEEGILWTLLFSGGLHAEMTSHMTRSRRCSPLSFPNALPQSQTTASTSCRGDVVIGGYPVEKCGLVLGRIGNV